MPFYSVLVSFGKMLHSMISAIGQIVRAVDLLLLIQTIKQLKLTTKETHFWDTILQ